jgi:hypothetical protein
MWIWEAESIVRGEEHCGLGFQQHEEEDKFGASSYGWRRKVLRSNEHVNKSITSEGLVVIDDILTCRVGLIVAISGR